MAFTENKIICKCKKVSLFDIEDALKKHMRFEDVEKEFEALKQATGCSTGCGGCHDKIVEIISSLIYQ